MRPSWSFLTVLRGAPLATLTTVVDCGGRESLHRSRYLPSAPVVHGAGRPDLRLIDFRRHREAVRRST